MSKNSQKDILIVDDILTNVQLLKDVLVERGYKVRAAINGKTALMLSRAKPPDLILLDIQMPEMNGYETCEELKKDEKTKDIPVIFVSALNEVFDKIKGFRLGAVDYVSKPIEIEEVLARVNTHLEIRRLQKNLHEKNVQLTGMNHEKDELMNILAHDIRTPLSTILMTVDLVLFSLNSVTDEQQNPVDRLQDIKIAVKRIDGILNSLLDAKRIESGELVVQQHPVMLIPKIKSVISENSTALEFKNITVKTNLSPDADRVSADPGFVQQVLSNLFSNAIKYSPKNSTVTISLYEHKNSVRLGVQDQGLGLTSEDKNKLFGKFTRLSAKPTAGERSVGLGLYIVKKLVESMNAKVWAESEGKGKGSTFLVEFPKDVSSKSDSCANDQPR